MTLPPRILLATGNPDKVDEWRALMASSGVACDWQALPDVEETASDYIGNAQLKALAAAQHTGRLSLGDDAGLEVDALGGAPGLWTRRWAMEQGGWQAALDSLGAVVGSGAQFYCGLALAWPDGRMLTVLGSSRGHIVPPRVPGVGLEPCFQPEGAELPLPALPDELRRQLHYRAVAWRELVALIERS
jgi:XTP/dITP diphosphohydrolase